MCKECRRAEVRANPRQRYAQWPETRRARANERERQLRQDPAQRARFVLKDTRADDRRNGRANDLTLDFIIACLSTGCSYCGAVELKLTLDRVDNDLGHITTNVRAACVRCNYLRRDMPFDAWMILVPAVRAAYASGAFKDWIGGISRKAA